MMLIEGIATLFVLVSGMGLILIHSRKEKDKLKSLDVTQSPFKFGFVNSFLLLSFTLLTALISYVIQTPEGGIAFFVTLLILAFALVINFMRIGTRKMKRYLEYQNR